MENQMNQIEKIPVDLDEKLLQFYRNIYISIEQNENIIQLLNSDERNHQEKIIL